MSKTINTSPLRDAASDGLVADNRPTMISVRNVSMIFNMASEQLNSLKEYAIALARRELRFKEFRALDNVSFEVKKGDVFGILGTNGSGKSTMLKIIAGVLEPSEGSCEISGNIAPLIELGAGFDLELTARENIYLNGALLGYSKKFINQHFDEIVSFAEIEQFLDMPLKNYSSGMVARIAFAIATVIVPDILIVDEVLSVGDFMFQQKCEQRITELIKEHDVTVLIVSHSNDQIERLCNKAIWIEKGHTRMMGTAQEVCKAYRILGGRTGTPESEQRVFTLLESPTVVPDHIVSTVAGEDRYSTAVKFAEKAGFSQGGFAIVAPGDAVPPCMIATSLSSLFGAPILYSKFDALPDITAQSLHAFAPQEVVVIGNEGSIAPTVLEEISETCGQDTIVRRIDGQRESLLATNSFEYGLRQQARWGQAAILAHGECLGEFITIMPYLYAEKAPLFFEAQPTTLDEATVCALLEGQFQKIVVLEGRDRFSDECLAPFVKAGIEIVRLQGSDPYHANDVVNTWLLKEAEGSKWMDLGHVFVGLARNPFDAFASSAYASKTRSPYLLTDPADLDGVAHALDYIRDQSGAIRHLTFLGGDSVFNKFDKELLGKAVVESLHQTQD